MEPFNDRFTPGVPPGDLSVMAMLRQLPFRALPASVSNLSMNQVAAPQRSIRWARLLSSASAVAVAWMLVTYARFVPATSLDGTFVAAAVAPLCLRLRFCLCAVLVSGTR